MVARFTVASYNYDRQAFWWWHDKPIFGATGPSRQWLAGDVMTLADFALAAHLSALDYLGDVAWDTSAETRQWYARIKSRPAFRTLLTDRVPGMPAAAGYADLDF